MDLRFEYFYSGQIHTTQKKAPLAKCLFLLNAKSNKNYFSAKYVLMSASSRMFCVLKM